MSIVAISTVVALGLALAFAYAVLRRAVHRQRVMTDPDGPRTLMPGFKG